jgi:hypothetical protein
MASIQSFSCHSCGRNPSDGVSVFRVNATGQKGIWACQMHYNDPVPEIEAMVAELEACSDMGMTPKQVGEVLGVRIING